MSEEEFKEVHEYKLDLLDKIPYEITSKIPSEVFANMSIEQLEKLNPSYKPPKEKKELTPEDQEI